MASGLVAGCWVFLAGTMPLAKYTNSEKSKGEVATCPFRVPPPSSRSRTPTIRPSYRREYSNCNPFAMWKETSAEPLRSDSMGIDIQIYLTEVPLPSTLPCPPFSCTLILSLFPSRSLLAFFFPAMKTVTRNRCKLLGVGKGTGEKKNLHLARFFFPFPSSAVDTRGLDLERKPRRQMRASARGNCSSFVDISGGVSSARRSRSREKRRCRVTRSFDANKSLEVDTIGAPIFIEMRYENWKLQPLIWRVARRLHFLLFNLHYNNIIFYIENVYTIFLWNIERLNLTQLKVAYNILMTCKQIKIETNC